MNGMTKTLDKNDINRLKDLATRINDVLATRINDVLVNDFKKDKLSHKFDRNAGPIVFRDGKKVDIIPEKEKIDIQDVVDDREIREKLKYLVKMSKGIFINKKFKKEHEELEK